MCLTKAHLSSRRFRRHRYRNTQQRNTTQHNTTKNRIKQNKTKQRHLHAHAVAIFSAPCTTNPTKFLLPYEQNKKNEREKSARGDPPPPEIKKGGEVGGLAEVTASISAPAPHSAHATTQAFRLSLYALSLPISPRLLFMLPLSSSAPKKVYISTMITTT